MTKETKIGLLVGLGVIIFIGILISDHLSVATQQQPADLTRDTGTGNSSTPQPQNTWTVDPHRAPLPVPVDEQQQIAVDDTTTANDNRSLQRLGDFHTDSLTLDTGRDGITDQHNTDDATTHVIDVPHNDNASDVRWYTVQSGDSLYKIAQKFYHDGSAYPAIFQANKARNIMKSAGDVRPGMRIVIPNRDSDNAAPQPTQTQHTDNTVTPTTQTAGATTTYTIKSGDVLGVLAQKFYGTSRAWPKLVALNPGVITDPDHLVAGQTIKVPKQ